MGGQTANKLINKAGLAVFQAIRTQTEEAPNNGQGGLEGLLEEVTN
jgi:hypothetical protein